MKQLSGAKLSDSLGRSHKLSLDTFPIPAGSQ
ncbi:hypothetical protein SAMN05216289_11350 [Dokdonella immobilis]|uniref:Uncharacterized protein n=1 Tax=Dokdonella immobilis TaxID=578942 RepID=A0A1I4XYP8_9GAMM|nr:hypothetical protein SAMN05216289_11350 [Dokdonella immobilis]